MTATTGTFCFVWFCFLVCLRSWHLYGPMDTVPLATVVSSTSKANIGSRYLEMGEAYRERHAASIRLTQLFWEFSFFSFFPAFWKLPVISLGREVKVAISFNESPPALHAFCIHTSPPSLFYYDFGGAGLFPLWNRTPDLEKRMLECSIGPRAPVNQPGKWQMRKRNMTGITIKTCICWSWTMSENKDDNCLHIWNAAIA